MRCILVAAISQDGFLTKGNDPDVSMWTSKEDKEFFADIRSRHKLYVFGRNTYVATNPKPSADALRIVLTTKPDEYRPARIPHANTERIRQKIRKDL
jgi:dihydrofolate reductase